MLAWGPGLGARVVPWVGWGLGLGSDRGSVIISWRDDDGRGRNPNQV